MVFKASAPLMILITISNLTFDKSGIPMTTGHLFAFSDLLIGPKRLNHRKHTLSNNSNSQVCHRSQFVLCFSFLLVNDSIYLFIFTKSNSCILIFFFQSFLYLFFFINCKIEKFRILFSRTLKICHNISINSKMLKVLCHFKQPLCTVVFL